MPEIPVFFDARIIQQVQNLLAGGQDPSGLIDNAAAAQAPNGDKVMASYTVQPDGTVRAETWIAAAHNGTPATSAVDLKPNTADTAFADLDLLDSDGQSHKIRFATQEVTLQVNAAQADDIAKLMAGTETDDSKSGTPLLKLSATFGAGYEADITVVQAGEDETPWIDASLFHNGNEVHTLEPCEDDLLGEYPFTDDETGREFVVTLTRAPSVQLVQPPRSRRSNAAHETWI